MSSSYKLQLISDNTIWDYYFLLPKKTNLSQSWHYGNAKMQAQRWKIIRYIITENDRPIALIQTWHKKFIFLKLVRVSYGPVWIIENPSAHQIKSVFQLIKNKWRLKKCSILLIAPNLENTPENNIIIKKLRFYKRKSMPYESGLVDLTKSIENLRIQLRQNWRNQLKTAEKNKLLFQVSQNTNDFEWIMSCFETLRKEKNFYGHHSELLKALFHGSSDNYETYVGIIFQNEEKIAGILFSRYGISCVPLIIWVSKNGRTLNAGNFLLWNCVLYAKNIGCLWFDLGGTNNSTKFKTGLPNTPYRLIGEYCAF